MIVPRALAVEAAHRVRPEPPALAARIGPAAVGPAIRACNQFVPARPSVATARPRTLRDRGRRHRSVPGRTPAQTLCAARTIAARPAEDGSLAARNLRNPARAISSNSCPSHGVAQRMHQRARQGQRRIEAAAGADRGDEGAARPQLRICARTWSRTGDNCGGKAICGIGSGPVLDIGANLGEAGAGRNRAAIPIEGLDNAFDVSEAGSASSLWPPMMTTAARSTFSAAGRTYGGQRNRFMLGTTPEGASEVLLGDGEVATVTVDAEGNTVVSIENKPAAEPATAMANRRRWRASQSRPASSAVSPAASGRRCPGNARATARLLSRPMRTRRSMLMATVCWRWLPRSRRRHPRAESSRLLRCNCLLIE